MITDKGNVMRRLEIVRAGGKKTDTNNILTISSAAVPVPKYSVHRRKKLIYCLFMFRCRMSQAY